MFKPSQTEVLGLRKGDIKIRPGDSELFETGGWSFSSDLDHSSRIPVGLLSHTKIVYVAIGYFQSLFRFSFQLLICLQ